MEEAECSSNPGPMLPTFIVKLWNMINNPDTQDIIHWNEVGNAFIIQDQIVFYSTILPTYYKHKNMTSFIRQLNLYGFHKVSNVKSHLIEFYHPFFQKDEPDLLTLIKRRTPVSSHKSSTVISPTNNREIQKVITEVKQIKDKQDTVDYQLEQLRDENSAMWYELNDLRAKHAKQTKIINKLMQFLIKFVQPNVKNLHTPRARPSSSGGATIFEVDGDDGASEYWKQYDERMIESKPVADCPKMIENRTKKINQEMPKDKDNSLAVASYKSPSKVLNEIYNMLKSNRNIYEFEDVKSKKQKIESAISSDYETCDDSLLEVLESKLSESSSNEDDDLYMCLPVKDKTESQPPAISYEISSSELVPETKKSSVKASTESPESQPLNFELVPCDPTDSNATLEKNPTRFILKRKLDSKALDNKQVKQFKTNNEQSIVLKKAKSIDTQNEGTKNIKQVSKKKVDIRLLTDVPTSSKQLLDGNGPVTNGNKQIYTGNDIKLSGINNEDLVIKSNNKLSNGNRQQISNTIKQIAASNSGKQVKNSNKQININRSDGKHLIDTITNEPVRNFNDQVANGKKQIINTINNKVLTDNTSNKLVAVKNPLNQVLVTKKQRNNGKGQTNVVTGGRNSGQMIVDKANSNKRSFLKYLTPAVSTGNKNITAPVNSEVTLSDIDEILKEASAEPELESQSDTAKRKQDKISLSGEALDQHVQNMDVDLANLKDILNNCEIDPDVLLDMFSNELSTPVDSQIAIAESGGSGAGNSAQTEVITNLNDSDNYSLDCVDVNLPFDDFVSVTGQTK